MNKILLVALLFTLIGCTQKNEFIGKWGYVNSEEEYAEMWFNNDQVMMIDASFYQVQLFDYTYDQDSIYLKRDDEILFSIGYKFQTNKILDFNNRYQISTLEKISDELTENFEYSDKLVQSIREEFVQRAENWSERLNLN